jgi:hypothetical protein
VRGAGRLQSPARSLDRGAPCSRRRPGRRCLGSSMTRQANQTRSRYFGWGWLRQPRAIHGHRRQTRPSQRAGNPGGSSELHGRVLRCLLPVGGRAQIWGVMVLGSMAVKSSTPACAAYRCRRWSWLKAITSTGPRAMASRTSLSERADNVNITAAGSVRVSVTIGDESEALTMLPGSIRRTPMRPSLGATMEV